MLPKLIANILLVGIFCSVSSFAQDERKIEISLAPSININYSYFSFAKGFSKANFIYTQRRISARGINFGLAAKMTIDNNWVIALEASGKCLGGGPGLIQLQMGLVVSKVALEAIQSK